MAAGLLTDLPEPDAGGFPSQTRHIGVFETEACGGGRREGRGAARGAGGTRAPALAGAPGPPKQRYERSCIGT